jgi:hypothetical protein
MVDIFQILKEIKSATVILNLVMKLADMISNMFELKSSILSVII